MFISPVYFPQLEHSSCYAFFERNFLSILSKTYHTFRFCFMNNFIRWKQFDYSIPSFWFTNSYLLPSSCRPSAFAKRLPNTHFPLQSPGFYIFDFVLYLLCWYLWSLAHTFKLLTNILHLTKSHCNVTVVPQRSSHGKFISINIYFSFLGSSI